MNANPDRLELESYFTTMSNWGRWGQDDQRGALNLITDARVVDASRLVQTGHRISCARQVEWAPRPSPVEALIPPIHFMQRSGEAARGSGMDNAFDWAGLPLHGMYVTHLDAPSHVFWNGRMYNGIPASEVSTDRGARRCSVDAAAASIVGRGVLLDVAGALGVGSLADSTGITPDDLVLAERQSGAQIGEGDIVLIRTGYGSRRPGQTADLPGLTAACIPWINERQPAVIGTDTGTDVHPSGYVDVEAPVHAVCLVAMGIWIVDNCDLEPLAAAAAALDRYRFLCIIEPLRLKNATGCPVNPIAVL